MINGHCRINPSPFHKVILATLLLAFTTSCGLPPNPAPLSATLSSTATTRAALEPYPANARQTTAPSPPTPRKPYPPAATETVEPTITQPAPPTPVPASWKTFSAPSLNIHFRYPAEWQAKTPENPGSLGLRLSGASGFVEISLREYPASLFDVMRTVCVLEANPDQAGVFGAAPLIVNWQGWDIEQQAWAGSGCAVMPGSDLPSDAAAQGVLFARYPPPLMHGKLLVLRADNDHFSGILSTLRFQNYTTPTPSSGYYNSPACDEAKVGAPRAALRTGGLVITETAIASSKCNPWNHFDGFQALVTSSGLQAARIMAIQKGLTTRQDNNTTWLGADGLGFAYASAPLFPVGAPARVNITRDGQVVDSLAVAQAGPAGYPVHGFWSWKGHWLLEMDSVVVEDGQVLNNTLNYAQIFEWHLMKDEPFFFYQKDTYYGIRYAGQELALRYDDIIHGQLCCDPGVYSIISTPAEVWFYARRDDIWYLVQVQVK